VDVGVVGGCGGVVAGDAVMNGVDVIYGEILEMSGTLV
jgi:hypothetical protein